MIDYYVAVGVAVLLGAALTLANVRSCRDEQVAPGARRSKPRNESTPTRDYPDPF